MGAIDERRINIEINLSQAKKYTLRTLDYGGLSLGVDSRKLKESDENIINHNLSILCERRNKIITLFHSMGKIENLADEFDLVNKQIKELLGL